MSRLVLFRAYSTDKKAEAAKLAVQSLKDMGTMFLSESAEEAVQPIDTAPIFEDPRLFGSLSLLHQGQVLKELQEKFDKNWNKLSLQDKKLGYFIAYGNWGVREHFTNWATAEAPYDLPFKVPSQLQSTSPSPSTIIRKLEPVVLAETPVRQKQFDTKKMDPVTKTLIYITLFISLWAIARDKNTGEEGMPREIVIADPYEEERQKRELEKIKPPPAKKWYYLWLK